MADDGSALPKFVYRIVAYDAFHVDQQRNILISQCFGVISAYHTEQPEMIPINHFAIPFYFRA